MQLNIANGSYSDPCIDINNQLCINWFPAYSSTDGRGGVGGDNVPKVLKQTHGNKLLTDLGGSGYIRSQTVFAGIVYVVAGNVVYKISVDPNTLTPTATPIGTLSSSEGYVSVANNLFQLMWVDGTRGYIYDTTTSTFSTITDPDFIPGTYVRCTGGYFFTNRNNSAVVACSALNNGLAWNALDFTTCAVSSDNLVALALSHEELWCIGTNSIEVYYNAANASGFPYALRTGLSLLSGTVAPFSIIEYNNNIYFLDDKATFVVAGNSDFIRDNNSGYQVDKISTPLLTEALQSYTNLADCIGTWYNDRGHIMLSWTFPTDMKTWVYDLTTSQWHEHSYFSTYSSAQEHSLNQFVSRLSTFTLCSGVRDNKLYLMGAQYKDDAGINIRRKRTTPFIYTRDDLTKMVTIYSLYLKVGLIDIPNSGEYIDPQIGLRYSPTGGHTWSSTLWRSTGKIGEDINLISWHSIGGTSRQWVFELTTSDPVSLAIIDCSLVAEAQQ